MIERQVLEKRINEKPIFDIKNPTINKDISISVQASQDIPDSIDFKDLYQQALEINQELLQKIELLQQKIKLLQVENYQLRQNYKKYISDQPSSITLIPPLMKKSQRELFFQEILSFKVNLPNSMKYIQFEELEDFDSLNLVTDQLIMSEKNFCNSSQTYENSFQNYEKNQNSNLEDQNQIAAQSKTMKIINDESLIDCLALYGLSKQTIYDEQKEDYFFQGELTYCSKAPHQIIKHGSRLMFPSKMRNSQIKVMENEEAVQNVVGLISELLKSQMKAFTLIFEPATIPCDKRKDYEFKSKMDNCEYIIDLVNRERRFYAICLAFDDFDIVGCLKGQKQRNQEEEGNSIRVSRKIMAIFTKYPFIPFFQELLIHCLKESLEQRKQEMRKNLSALGNFDHSKTLNFIKIFYSNFSHKYKVNHRFEHKLNEIFKVKLMSARINELQILSVQLSRPPLKNYYSQMWAYPILRLFTIDSFLDVLTMILLEEKVIFVSSNEHILTSAVFLFTQVLLKPFNYPYPVVSIIPNEYDYFNAPFPIVYGCLNSKENLIKQKIPQIYKNIYIVLSPSGVQILNHRNFLAKNQNKKKPLKLRDKLLSSFDKMENYEKKYCPQQNLSSRFSGIASFLGFTSPNLSPSQSLSRSKYIFSNNNRQISHQIIQKVIQFLNDIKLKLPSREQVQQIKLNIEKQIKQETLTKDSKNIDVDKQTLEKIINKLSKKTLDPFVQKFLQTQIISIQILS